MIIAITGTGTGVGKTHVACALIAGLRATGVRAVGWKPVESGVTADDTSTDEARIRAASGGSSAPTLRLRAPLSPHLAARREGVTIDNVEIRSALDQLAAQHAVVVLELAGGLFSPFDDRLDNADWLATVPDLRVIVVAPDRLGVLHDTVATVRAAGQVGLRIHAIVTSPPAVRDDSTGTNAAELRARPALHGLVIVELARAPVSELARSAALLALGA